MWTETECTMLRDLYQKHGAKWTILAKHYPTKTEDSVRKKIHRLCNIPYAESTKIQSPRNVWSKHEDAILFNYLLLHSKIKWTQIKNLLLQKGFERKTNAIRNRYFRLMKKPEEYFYKCIILKL
jgi:hypothetical protein